MKEIAKKAIQYSSSKMAEKNRQETDEIRDRKKSIRLSYLAIIVSIASIIISILIAVLSKIA